ncbi:MAG: thiamine phosphate synthase [Hyphomicrobiaceae bacterium]
MTKAPTGCRLYAVLEAGDAAGERLAAAQAAAGLAVVLIAPAAGQRLAAAEARPLVDRVRKAEATALVLDDARLARSVGADGVHLGGPGNPPAAYAAAREAMGGEGVVGADAGISRHAAMVLAEAGADYIGFGAPPHLGDRQKARLRRVELISWWAPIFEVPCVAFDVETPEEAQQLAAAGADFIAVALPSTLAAEAARGLVASVAEAIQTSKPSP